MVSGKRGRSSMAGRQRVRKAVLLISLILFPVTIFYFSPVLIVQGALQGIIAGSFLVFCALFLASLVLGRGWCGWVCPTGGFQEYCALLRDKRARGGRYNWIKFFIWVPWLAAIVAGFIAAGGVKEVNPIYRIDWGISVAVPQNIMVLVIMLLVMLVLVLLAGRRGFCHYACWMAPFMIVGRRVSNATGLPALRLRADEEECIDCKKCTGSCPMSLDVNRMVRSGDMEDSECILCGVCADACPQGVIELYFGRRRRKGTHAEQR